MAHPDPFAAIADPNRRFLLEELRRAPRTVNELSEGLPISRPAVSQHLKALLDSNLVSVKAEGTKRIYAINAKGFDRLNLWLDQFWS
ncbi:ArsR family transcriptional regulator [Shinella sp. WSJ-2]|jgi:DNA-binding transcriptional ArsR family regulator|uniref:Metalloregulator ArsR/SmtB family transcription factor n=1 Tax=Shinella curvata TaxID=1817964 RepID=A0ABT8XE12_9HYPH|nr:MULTISPECIES: metalloregulator ArsR/SmtB family transcription factor [Shinella]MBO9628091.1 winged helix-turn-helix transcriptional regulator [Shinella sp.]MCJ8055460.1 metalloregulator ArsR/SmtB family transcription factor [Shinella curvata]MDO6121877.1 metalloregulator ArsR/SmtB family transcription factor [Shinella curvata]RFZ87053.1 ArsR family transcriptional regulator [Shinella sp. WSJ-2]WPE21187.1 HTH-type transcriptional regulator [Shinella zoogloeoides]